MTATKFNPVQLHLLQLFAHDLGPTELAEIKVLLTDYLVRKADEEMQRLQAIKPTSQTDLEAILDTHLRTPYKAS